MCDTQHATKEAHPSLASTRYTKHTQCQEIVDDNNAL